MSADPRNTCLVHPGQQCACGFASADQLVGIGGSFSHYNNQPPYPNSTGCNPQGSASGTYPYQSGPRWSAGSAAQLNGPSRQQLSYLNSVAGFNSPVQTSYYYPTSSDLNAFLSDSPPNPASTPYRSRTEPQRPSDTQNGTGLLASRDVRTTQQYLGQNNVATHQTHNGLNPPNANGSGSNQYNNTDRRTPTYSRGSDRGQDTPNRRHRRRELPNSSENNEDSDENSSHRARARRR